MRRKYIYVLLIALVLCVMGFSCKTNPGTSGPIKVGSVLSLTGDLAEYGMRCREGIDMAVEEINANGGINGRPLQVVYEDDKGVPTEGVAAFNKLTTLDKVPVVIGAVSSSVTLAIEPIATRQQIFLFSPVSSSPKIPGKSKYLYTMWPPDTLEARALAEFAKERLNKSKVAILYVDSEYGLGLMEQFRNRAQELGMQVVATEAYPLNNKDFRLVIPKIKQANPDFIFLAGYHKEMAFATKEIREAGMDQQIFGNTDYEVDELLKIAGKAAEGAIYATPRFNPEQGGAIQKQFAAKFKEKHHKDPSLFQANAYDLVHFIAAAFKANGTNGDALVKYVPTIRDYEGASGRTSFTERGEVVKDITIKTVRDGRFTEWK
jgi:branched-chain amino acid transport system substrate-binding protein